MAIVHGSRNPRVIAAILRSREESPAPTIQCRLSGARCLGTACLWCATLLGLSLWGSVRHIPMRLQSKWLLCLALAAPLAAQTKLLRFPDIHDNRIVFTYGGDLWMVAATGGTATRLTAHPGVELFAKFSPDGKWIAFTGQYDGDEQVYVMPAAAASRRQLTFYPARGPLAPRWGYDNQVYGWTNDGKYVIFRSMRDGWRPRLQPPVPRLDGWRPCRAAAHAEFRRRIVFARRQPDRLFAAVARFPHREALQRRTGQSALHLRHRDARSRNASPKATAPAAIPCGSATRSTSIPTTTATSTSTPTTPPSGKTTPDHPQHAYGTCAGPAPTAKTRIVYELDGELQMSSM